MSIQLAMIVSILLKYRANREAEDKVIKLLQTNKI